MEKTSPWKHVDGSFVGFKGKMTLLVFIFMILNGQHVQGRSSYLKASEKRHAVKTTTKNEDGDVIDCVDIYKQPAFDHPLLKNHTIQMRPSEYPKGQREMVPSEVTQSLFRKGGNCPQGTIPILRSYNPNTSIKPYINRESTGLKHENWWDYYHGISALINVWNAHVEPTEYSFSAIWLIRDPDPDTNFINAGFMIQQPLYHDNKTRVTASWSIDNGATTGCYNLWCPGFVQVNNKLALGSAVSQVSTYNGEQFEMLFKIYKDRLTNNWWLMVGDIPVGYWPISIFINLDTASTVKWNGQILNLPKAGEQHTMTQMGSGHFPNEGYGKAAYFRRCLMIDRDYVERPPQHARVQADKPRCYNAKFGDGEKRFWVNDILWGAWHRPWVQVILMPKHE